MVRNLPCKEGDMGLLPGQETKAPHTTGQLSLRVADSELVLQSPHMCRSGAPAWHKEIPQATARAWGSQTFFKCTMFFKSLFQQRRFLGHSGQVKAPRARL